MVLNTRNQALANDYDMRLYRLLSEASARAADMALTADQRAEWRDVYDLLAASRMTVRAMMSTKDLEETR